MSDPRNTEDAAKDSLPGSDPEVNKTAGDKLAPASGDNGEPKTDGSDTSESH